MANQVYPEISGILFTADPVTGSHMRMTGSYSNGQRGGLVSGDLAPEEFAIERPQGRYDGPSTLKPYARRLYKLAVRLEKEQAHPQQIEWAVTGGRVKVLQSQPVVALQGYDAPTGDWNDSLTGDFLWSRNNFGEARPDVMSPFTYSLSEKVWSEISFLPGYHLSGNICGRYYANVSVAISMSMAMGKSKDAALAMMKGLLGNVPEDLEIPLIPLPRSVMLLALPRMIRLGMKEKAGGKGIPQFLAMNPARCRALRQRIQEIDEMALLAAFWHEEIMPRLLDSIWIMGGSAQPLESKMKLRDELIELVGEADANALFSSLSSEDEMLASLGPVVGVSKVARGEMNRAEYLEKYGHRGPQEAELSEPRPAEDPAWLDRQLAEYEKEPVDVDALLARRQVEFEAAWQRLQQRHPKKAQKLRPKIEAVGPAARLRETVRDEITRFLWVEREWALRAGVLTGLGNDIFFLTIDEVLALLTGEAAGGRDATRYIPARKETHARYRALPPYPMIIRGRFDVFEWASDPDRRNDIYDATAPAPASRSNTITGFAGAAGQVEGLVRVLDGPELGDQLEPGEILVAVTTNVGWTPIFPHAAAVVTDVGAPLSHAAIVARELGIPAVVGCGSATTRLRTGDRVRVDGGGEPSNCYNAAAMPQSLSEGNRVAGGTLGFTIVRQDGILSRVAGGDEMIVEAWNDSLAGDFLWSNVNFGEAVTEVMTPLTWSVIQFTLDDWIFLPGRPTVGVIGGRPYLNISVFATVLFGMGRSRQDLLNSLESTLYMRLPDEMPIPIIPVSRGTLLRGMGSALRVQWRQRRGVKTAPAYVDGNRAWFQAIRQEIQSRERASGLRDLWHSDIRPHIKKGVWCVLGSASHSADYTQKLRRQLVELAGPEDADFLIANLSDEDAPLESLGPLAGLDKLARGEISRAAYLGSCGHRGPHEFELSVPRPAEDPMWLDQELERMRRSPVDVQSMVAEQGRSYAAAWERLQLLPSREARHLGRKIRESARRARLRELARSAYVRDRWAIRLFALRAGDMTGLGDRVFFLTLGEMMALLSGDRSVTQAIGARIEVYQKYKDLPPYPSVIRGQFDPFAWAAHPNRPTGFFDAQSRDVATHDPDLVAGSPGSAGIVEGIVRVLDGPEAGDCLQKGEIMVTVQTDIAWTLLFPRAGAIVTDVGAPLSHAAIVARELGIPAVVGCGNATAVLKTGDRVRVDGGRGTVEVLKSSLMGAPAATVSAAHSLDSDEMQIEV